MLSALTTYLNRRCHAVRRFLRRITPFTWLIWGALVADLSAPGYLVFNLVITDVNAQVVATEVLALWKLATDASAN